MVGVRPDGCRRWGAAARTGSDGRAAALLPLPDPGRAQITANSKPDMAAASYATWIWAKEVRDGQSVTLERTFTLAGTPRRAALFMTCDDSFSARINGASVLSGSNFQKVEFATGLERLLKRGENRVVVDCRNGTGPAGSSAASRSPPTPVRKMCGPICTCLSVDHRLAEAKAARLWKRRE